MKENQRNIYKKIFSELESNCIYNNVRIEEFIAYVLSKENIEEEEHISLKQLIIDEFSKLNNKLEQYHKRGTKDVIENSIIIISLKSISQPLPKEISKVLAGYKKFPKFNKDYFYLITNRKKILGFFGLSINDEPTPFGKYVYIYAYKLDQEYENPKNVSYILNYIEGVAKKEKVYNLDISDNICRINANILRAMGYIGFCSTQMIRLTKKGVGEGSLIKEEKEEQYSLEDIKEYLPLERTRPVYDILHSNKQQKIIKLIYDNSNIITKVYIIQLLDTNKEILKIDLFLYPISIYDNLQVYECIKEILNYLGSIDIKGELVIGLPTDIIQGIEHIDYERIEEVRWYRKVLTYINKE